MKEYSFPIVIRIDPTPCGPSFVVFGKPTREQSIQNGPFSGYIRWIRKSPTDERKRTTNQTEKQTIHLAVPSVLFSATQFLHFRPPANRKNVWTAMMKDHIAEATSPVWRRNPCKVQIPPGTHELVRKWFATRQDPRTCTKSRVKNFSKSKFLLWRDL